MSTTVPVSPFTPHDDDGGVGEEEVEDDDAEEEEEDDDDDDDVEVDLEGSFALVLALVPLMVVGFAPALFWLAFNASTCLALSCVNTRMGLCPAF